MTELNALWIVVAALFILKLQSGFLLLETGTVRWKNAANVAIKNISDICVVGLAYWAVGYALMFGPSIGGVFGLGEFFPALDNRSGFLAAPFLFQMAFAATAVTIVSGAVAEREWLKGYLISTLLLGGMVYPIVGHWVWGNGGWLSELGFIDFAGASTVHGVGGWAALVAVIVLGPRLGRYGPKKRYFEENNVALTTFGGMILWIGWGAFNGGSAMAFNLDVAPIMARTMLTAVGAGCSGLLIGLVFLGHVRVEMLVSCLLGGLVAGTAGIHFMTAQSAILVGIAGAVTVIVVRDILDWLKIDDVIGAVPVHLAAGAVGTLSVAFIVPEQDVLAGSRLHQFGIQLFGVVAIGAWVVGVMLPLYLVLKRLGLFRACPKDEVRGLNIAENNQRNLLVELAEEMRRHQNSGAFGSRVRVERSTSIGALAFRYNRVLDRVEEEIQHRMESVRQEQKMREIAEEAFEAMRSAQEESAWVSDVSAYGSK